MNISGTSLIYQENNKFITTKSSTHNLMYPNIKHINHSNPKSNKLDSNKDSKNKLLSNIKIYTSWKNFSISTCVNPTITHSPPKHFPQSSSKKSPFKYLNIKDKITTLLSDSSTLNPQSMLKVNSKIIIKNKNLKKTSQNIKMLMAKMASNSLTEKNTLLN